MTEHEIERRAQTLAGERGLEELEAVAQKRYKRDLNVTYALFIFFVPVIVPIMWGLITAISRPLLGLAGVATGIIILCLVKRFSRKESDDGDVIRRAVQIKSPPSENWKFLN